MTRDDIMMKLSMDYAARREDDRARHEAREAEACERCHGLAELLEARRAALMTGVRQSILSPVKREGAMAAMPAAMADFNRRIREALIAGGLREDFLQPEYQCPLCRDEGYIYDPSKRMCECMAREYGERVMEALGLKDDAQTFDNFDESLFDATEDDKGLSQRKAAIINRNVCERYADAYPGTDKRDILLMGKSGLGKTYLLRAMQHRLAERGQLPVYSSAYHFFEVARQAYIENNSDRIAELMDAPILLLDDLGTEPLMNNVTVAQLFNLLNERQTAGRHTVISTNLSMPELCERYTERVASRLTDASACHRLVFIGDDIRKRKGARRK